MPLDVGTTDDGRRVADQREQNTLVPFTREVSPQISAVIAFHSGEWVPLY